MKNHRSSALFGCVTALALLSAPLVAEDVHLASGAVFRNVTVIRTTADGIVFRLASDPPASTRTLTFDAMAAADRARYGDKNAPLATIPPLPAVPAAASTTRTSISLKVTETATKALRAENSRDLYGSDLTVLRSRSLSIRLSNLGREPEDVELECYFIGKPPRGNTLFVHDVQRKKLSVKPSGWQDIPVQAKELSSREINDDFGRVSTGAKIQGWIVRVKKGDKIVAIDASSETLKSTDPEKLEQPTQPENRERVLN